MMNKPQFWPGWLDYVWAKSPAKEEAQGETLAEHTWQVLSRMADLRLLRPSLTDELNCPNLWVRLFWICLLHDLGKCAQGFQDKLHNQRETELAKLWSAHRHETISLAFVDWVFPASSAALAEDRKWVIGGIAAHHRDAGELQSLYPPSDDENVQDILASIAPETVRGIYDWIHDCAVAWAQSLDLPDGGLALLVTEAEAVAAFYMNGTARIRAALQTYQRWVTVLHQQANAAPAELLLRGLVTQADHTASAHAGQIRALHCDAAELKASWAAARLKQGKPFDLYAHQTSSQVAGTALLIAPTGSGKTEAALLWAATQPDAPRLFYTLPYQASMNAMFARLEDTFGKDVIGLSHGRALLALYRLIAEETPNLKDAEKQARRRKNLAGLHHLPVQIFSPYQMLKAVYRLKGYEGMITDFQGASFIFDEIHAYEAGRLALIVETMRYLRNQHAAQFFIMSATFPALIREKLNEALGEPRPITASPALYEGFCRHHLHVLAGDLFEPGNWRHIVHDIERDKTVLICCNTVTRAQEAQHLVAMAFPDAQVVLLHGRLTGRDRMQREQAVRVAVGSTSQNRTRIVLVATQVVEVSLDIDLDTIYTDPAPLEALVQRFGRVNRRRLQPKPAPVHVFTLPNDGQHIYKPHLVQRTLEILQREDDRPVAEDRVGPWLDEVYQGAARDEWLNDYAQQADFVRRVLLRGLRPFQSDPNIEEQFYAAFDGVDVLPMCFTEEHTALMETDPLRAQELFVSIRSFQYGQVKRKGRLRSAPGAYPIVVDVPYDAALGLNLKAI